MQSKIECIHKRFAQIMENPSQYTLDTAPFLDEGRLVVFLDFIRHNFLHKQRWFANKKEKIDKISLSAWHSINIANSTAILMLLEITTTSGLFRYFLPVSGRFLSENQGRSIPNSAIISERMLGNNRHCIFDASADSEFCTSVVSRILNAHKSPSDGKIEFTVTPYGAGYQIRKPFRAEPVLREQSNSAAMAGSDLFLKIFRGLKQGINPELEISSFLNEKTTFHGVVKLAGAMEWMITGKERYTLAILQEAIPHNSDGWTYSLEFLNSLLDEPAEGRSAKIAGYVKLAALLGRTTGALHTVLSDAKDSDTFKPEPLEMELLDRMSAEIRSRLNSLVSTASIEEPIRNAAAGFIEKLANELQSLDAIPCKIRIHGDFHLGQVLICSEGAKIIDFEGEPSKSVELRRAKHSPAKDLAGMLRSFDYAYHSTRISQKLSENDYKILSDWRESTEKAFISSWMSAVPPKLGMHIQPLIKLYQLDKVLYEINYEMNNRPDWIAIPVAGLKRLIGCETHR